MKFLSDALLVALMDDMRAVSNAEILPRFPSVKANTIRAKTAADDIVTEADTSAERALSERLNARFPGIAIIGEEAVSEDPLILPRLGEVELAAVIDPVDGTWHFAHGMPMFGSILAIVSGGETIAGLIYYPILDDFLVARPGEGAWHVGPDGAKTRLSVASATPIDQMHGFVPLHMFEPDLRAKMAPRLLRFMRTTTWRCSAYEYRMLATGAMSFCLNEGLNAWDHAAGILIHAEAGGYAAVVGGGTYRPTLTTGHLLTAPNEACWKEIATALYEDGRQ